MVCHCCYCPVENQQFGCYINLHQKTKRVAENKDATRQKNFQTNDAIPEKYRAHLIKLTHSQLLCSSVVQCDNDDAAAVFVAVAGVEVNLRFRCFYSVFTYIIFNSFSISFCRFPSLSKVFIN